MTYKFCLFREDNNIKSVKKPLHWVTADSQMDPMCLDIYQVLLLQIQTNKINKRKTCENCHSCSRWLQCFQQRLYVCGDTPTSVEQGARCHHSSVIQLLLCVILAPDTSVPVVTLKAHSVAPPIFVSWRRRQVFPY